MTHERLDDRARRDLESTQFIAFTDPEIGDLIKYSKLRVQEQEVDDIEALPNPLVAGNHAQIGLYDSELLSSRSKGSATTTSPNTTSTTTILLPRQTYIQVLVLLYSLVFLTAWFILAWTSVPPIGREKYGSSDSNYYCPSYGYRKRQNEWTRRAISTAQTLINVVALRTIPLTSTICAAAAVPWLQQTGRGMSRRQALTLANRDRTSPYI